MRDFRHELRHDKCWDRSTQALFEQHGEPLEDCILQNREELIGLCQFIEERQIRSYLEIGIWTGRLVSTLHRLFSFELVAACDHGWARQLGLPMALPDDVLFYDGDSASDGFRQWRAALGRVDLVLIDANHSYHAVRGDLELNRQYPHRFVALHDITGANRHTAGVKRLWNELQGHKHEIICPHLELGLQHSTMGIGVWGNPTSDPCPGMRYDHESTGIR